MANASISSATHTVSPSTSNRSVVNTGIDESPVHLPPGTLRLRAEPVQQRHIQWAEEVVDNEELGKKSSKVCCIHHKQREFGESSDESSSDESSSDGDSDNRPGDSTAGPATRARNTPRHHKHGDSGDRPTKSRPRSPNAYEKMPNYNKKKKNDANK